MGETNRKLFVLDTNILLHEPFAIFSFQEHDVVIPMTVLEELDRIKDSKRDVARDARIAIRYEFNIHDKINKLIAAMTILLQLFICFIFRIFLGSI